MRYLFLLVATLAFWPSEAHAQLGRLRNAARRVAGQVVDRTAGAAADRAGTAAEGAAAEGAIGGSGSTRPGTPEDGAAPDVSETDLAAYAASAPTGGLLFATNFSRDAVGDFPTGFSLGSGTFEVAAVRGRKVLRATAFGQIHVELPDDLPEQFTLEFEMAAPMGWGQEVRFQDNPQAYVTLAPSQGGLAGRTNAVSQPAANPGAGRLFPVRVVVDGDRVKVYHSRTLVANVPEAALGRSNRLTFSVSASQADPVLIANVRLSAGSATTGGGNPNYPGPTTGGSTPQPQGPGTTPVNGGRFEARSVGALDVELSGPATYRVVPTPQLGEYAITLQSEVNPQHKVELRLHYDMLVEEQFVIGAGGGRNGPDYRASATAVVGVGSVSRTFHATTSSGSGYVVVSGVTPSRITGHFQFEGRTPEGEGAIFSGTFDARQRLAGTN
jgi:hypothetical protein